MSPLRRKLEPFITPLFRLWWRINRGMTLGVRGVALDDQGRVLLVRHTYVEGWFLPGGGVESGETAVHALTREMAEEAGVELTAAPTLLGFYSNAAVFRNDHVLLYRINAWRPCPPTSEGEIAERGFFPVDALPEGVSNATRARLQELFAGGPPSEYWAAPKV
jgi:ADP-ribose pyrophosphatase YjhB (NUDIX family)